MTSAPGSVSHIRFQSNTLMRSRAIGIVHPKSENSSSAISTARRTPCMTDWCNSPQPRVASPCLIEKRLVEVR